YGLSSRPLEVRIGLSRRLPRVRASPDRRENHGETSQASRVLWPCSRLGPRSRVQQTFPVRGCSVGVCKKAFAHAIDTEPYRRARGTHRRGSGPQQKERFRQGLECGVSSDTFFLRSGEVRIELAEQG